MLEFHSTAAVRPSSLGSPAEPRLLFTVVPHAAAVVRMGSTGTRPPHNIRIWCYSAIYHSFSKSQRRNNMAVLWPSMWGRILAQWRRICFSTHDPATCYLRSGCGAVKSCWGDRWCQTWTGAVCGSQFEGWSQNCQSWRWHQKHASNTLKSTINQASD